MGRQCRKHLRMHPKLRWRLANLSFSFIPLAIPSRLYWLFNHNGPIVHRNLHFAPLNLTMGWGDSSAGRAFATPIGRPMLGIPRTHVKYWMAGHPYTVTSALDWTETGGITGACWPASYLKMASPRFNEETYGDKEESRNTGHLMSSSSVFTSTHWYTLPSCIQHHTHTHPHTPIPPQNKIKNPKPS